MQIGITNPLRVFLKWKPFAPNSEEPLIYCWDAHRVKIDGRVMLVVCNAANRFAGVRAMRAADWKHLGETCRDLIREALLDGGFSADAVEEYFTRAGEIEFGRTHGRKAVGCMNRLIDTLQWRQCDRADAYQAFLVHVANFDDLGSCAAHEGLGLAAERMEKDLRTLGIDPYGQVNRYATSPSTAQPAYSTAPGDIATPEAAPPGDVVTPGNIATPPVAPLDDETAAAQAKIADDINAVTRSMRLERGLDPDQISVYYGMCAVCGAEPRVFLGRIPYCLACYNELTERLMGVPHITNDRSVLAVFGPQDSLVQFAVERILTPPIARWTAREIVDADDPRTAGGYEGVEVNLFALANEDADETLSLLWEKAQQAISQPSTKTHEILNARGERIADTRVSNGAHVNGEVRFAENVGWARITEDEHGAYYAIVDGQRYDAEQFLGLFTDRIGFNLHWEVHDSMDPLPEPPEAPGL